MITINIAKDFSVTPGARYYTDGSYSGQEFYEKILKSKYEESVKSGVKLKIILDGTDGYASSFLNEAFRRLGKDFGPDQTLNNLIIISEEVPKYLKKVKESIYEGGK